jgi:hypothetical protein
MLHAMELILHSELFVYHDARMVGIMMADAQEVRPDTFFDLCSSDR